MLAAVQHGGDGDACDTIVVVVVVGRGNDIVDAGEHDGYKLAHNRLWYQLGAMVAVVVRLGQAMRTKRAGTAAPHADRATNYSHSYTSAS